MNDNNRGNDALTVFLAGCVTIPVALALIVIFAVLSPYLIPIIGIGIAAWCGLTLIRDWDKGEE